MCHIAATHLIPWWVRTYTFCVHSWFSISGRACGPHQMHRCLHCPSDFPCSSHSWVRIYGLSPLVWAAENQGNQINCTNAISEQSAETQALPWTLCSHRCTRGSAGAIAPLGPACFAFCTPSSLSRLALLSWTNISKGWLGELFSLLSATSATASGPWELAVFAAVSRVGY